MTMASEYQMMPMFDDLLEDFPLHPSLRIPPMIIPLQDPTPARTSGRLSPLEPNARINALTHNDTSKLTGRRKALAEAKLIGEPELNDGSISLVTLEGIGERSLGLDDFRPDLHGSQPKRQKLYEHERVPDFVQLPEPKAKVKANKPLPFEPISILNELHEPPPSAALFPPITPTQEGGEEEKVFGISYIAKEITGASPSRSNRSRSKSDATSKTTTKKPARPRPKWTEEETSFIVEGVQMFGTGKWKRILAHSEFWFQEGRTAVDLKDRFRTWTDRQRRSKGLGAERDERSIAVLNLITQPLISRQKGNSKARELLEAVSNRTRPQPKRKRNPKRPWTDAEDADLALGFRKHGFQWTATAKDPDLCLTNRTGPQIRDRFRSRYPDLYGKGYQPGEIPSEPIERSESRSETSKAGDQIADGDDVESDDRDDDEEEEDEDLGRRSSAVVGIMGLLNDEQEEVRPTSFRYDEWEEPVQLPPLLWEDMATRPMFDLE